MTVIVFVTKTKHEMNQLKDKIKSLCVYDHETANKLCSRVDQIRYQFLNIEQHNHIYLKGITINKLYFVMNQNDIPIDFIEAVYPVVCSSFGKVIQSEKFNLNLLVS